MIIRLFVLFNIICVSNSGSIKKQKCVSMPEYCFFPSFPAVPHTAQTINIKQPCPSSINFRAGGCLSLSAINGGKVKQYSFIYIELILNHGYLH